MRFLQNASKPKGLADCALWPWPRPDPDTLWGAVPLGLLCAGVQAEVAAAEDRYVDAEAQLVDAEGSSGRHAALVRQLQAENQHLHAQYAELQEQLQHIAAERQAAADAAGGLAGFPYSPGRYSPGRLSPGTARCCRRAFESRCCCRRDDVTCLTLRLPVHACSCSCS